jgi:hypothetical protein
MLGPDPRVTGWPRDTWYRNYSGRYHRASDEWVRTGLAICGADISRPAFVAGANPLRPRCKRCVARVAKEA